MKLLFILKLFLIIGCSTSNKIHHSSFNDYFFHRERIELEQELQDLEKDIYHHPYYSFGLSPNNKTWLHYSYNITKIAASLLKNFQPELTPKEAKEIGKSLNWIAVLRNDGMELDSTWHFRFEFASVSKNQSEVDPPRETELTIQWRKLTNRVLLWKTRQINWNFLLPWEDRKTSSKPMTDALLLSDLKILLERKFEKLIEESFDLEFGRSWIEILMNATTVCRRLLNDDHFSIPLKEINEQTGKLGWSFVQKTPNGEIYPDDYHFTMKSWLIQIDMNSWTDDERSSITEILQKWKSLTNHALVWKTMSRKKKSN